MKQSKICIQKLYYVLLLPRLQWCQLFLQVLVAWWSVSPHVTEHVSIPTSACRFHPSFHSADLCLVHAMDVNQAIWQGEATEPLGGREWTGGGWWCQNNSSYSPIPAPGWRPCKKTRVVGNHLQVDGVSWQFGPCLQSVGMVLADTSRIVLCLGFLKFLGWWQWCDVDSADDGSELKTIFCGTPNTARGKFNRSNVWMQLVYYLLTYWMPWHVVSASGVTASSFIIANWLFFRALRKIPRYLVAYVILRLRHSRDGLLPALGYCWIRKAKLLHSEASVSSWRCKKML